MKAHLPCDGTGAIDARIMRGHDGFVESSIASATAFYMRKTLAVAPQLGSANLQFWITPGHDWILQYAFIHATTNWTCDTAGCSITFNAQIETAASTFLTVATGTMAAADFVASSYNVAGKPAIWGLKSTERTDFVNNPASPIEFESGPNGIAGIGNNAGLMMLRNKVARLQVNPSNGAATVAGSVEVILAGLMLG